ncbi:MAG: zinc-ribbon domain-containing protein, partial [Chloroflexi bacterium]
MAQLSPPPCPQCGTPIAPGQRFCSNCGATADPGFSKPTAAGSGEH